MIPLFNRHDASNSQESDQLYAQNFDGGRVPDV